MTLDVESYLHRLLLVLVFARRSSCSDLVVYTKRLCDQNAGVVEVEKQGETVAVV